MKQSTWERQYKTKQNMTAILREEVYGQGIRFNQSYPPLTRGQDNNTGEASQRIDWNSRIPVQLNRKPVPITEEGNGNIRAFACLVALIVAAGLIFVGLS